MVQNSDSFVLMLNEIKTGLYWKLLIQKSNIENTDWK